MIYKIDKPISMASIDGVVTKYNSVLDTFTICWNTTYMGQTVEDVAAGEFIEYFLPNVTDIYSLASWYQGKKFFSELNGYNANILDIDDKLGTIDIEFFNEDASKGHHNKYQMYNMSLKLANLYFDCGIFKAINTNIVTGKHECHCPSYDLFHFGCKCGGI